MESCIICGSPWSSFQTKPDAKNYYFCRECGFIYLDPSYHPSPEKEKERYCKHNNSPGNTGYRHMLSRFINESIMPLGSGLNTVLDFGCGPVPLLADLLQEKKYHTEIYDKYFFSDRKVLSHSYDAIILHEVAEHFRDPKTELSALVPLIRETGYLIISTLQCPESRKEFNSWWYRMDITHLSFFREKTFKYLAGVFKLKFLDTENQNIFIFRHN